MNRREMLKNAATITGGKALQAALTPVVDVTAGMAEGETGLAKLDTQSSSIRKVPSSSLILQNTRLKVKFDPKDGLPYSYELDGQLLWGEDEGTPAYVLVCKLQPRDYREVPAQLVSVKQSIDSICFEYQASFTGQAAVFFSVRYVLSGLTLSQTMESIRERSGFELIEVAFPRLATVREEDGPAWMAEGRKGGSFVRLSSAKSFRFPDDPYFGRISTELPVGMVGRNGIGCVMEVTAFQDGTETEVKGVPGRRHATMGCVMTHRVHGGRCYNMNDGGPAVCGNAQTLNLIVGQTPLTRFDFFPYYDENHPWLTGAKIVRARMPAAPTQYLSNRFVYIVAGKRKIDAEPKTTFAQSKHLVRDIAALTDYAPQVAFISGFAYDGQDTGFPSEDKINSSLGSDEELRELIEFGASVNADVTLNVNWDDAYKSSPIFNESFIARRPDGGLWKSRAWDGEDSYVVGMAKFMSGGWGSKRIAFTIDHFKIHNTILIDAMSWFAIRNDWDPQHPASGYKNLVDGKYKVIEEFGKRGVAVTSEQLRYPFIGWLTESMDGPGVSGCPFGGEAVPMLSIILKGSAIWGGDPGGSIHPQRELFWNTRSALWFENDTDRTRVTDFYYLIALPFSKLHRLVVDRYESEGPMRCVFMEKSSSVAMDTSSTRYTAIWNGNKIANDDATFCPIDDDRIAFYATKASELQYPVPDGWLSSEMTARVLSVHGKEPFEISFEKGMVVVQVQAKQPVIVYRNQAIVDKSHKVFVA